MLTRRSMWPSNAHSQSRKPNVFWAASEEPWPNVREVILPFFIPFSFFIPCIIHSSILFFDIVSDWLFSGYLEVIWYNTPHVSWKADSDFIHWKKSLTVPKTDSSLFADYLSHSNTFSILTWLPILQEAYAYLSPVRLFNKFRFQKWTS